MTDPENHLPMGREKIVVGVVAVDCYAKRIDQMILVHVVPESFDLLRKIGRLLGAKQEKGKRQGGYGRSA